MALGHFLMMGCLKRKNKQFEIQMFNNQCSMLNFQGALRKTKCHPELVEG
jgi:hypothetical protein